jgi:translation initiation factor IF-2
MVQSGLIKRTADARLIRDNVVLWTGKLSGLRRFKDDAKRWPRASSAVSRSTATRT